MSELTIDLIWTFIAFLAVMPVKLWLDLRGLRWHARLASKSTADLPGGRRALLTYLAIENTILLLPVVMVTPRLADISSMVGLSGWQFYGLLLLAFILYGVAAIWAVRWLSPSMRRVADARNQLYASPRSTKPN